MSHSKEEQLVIREDDIFSDKKKEEFKILKLVEHTRHLLKGEIIKYMYPAEVLSKLSDDSSLDETTNDFISYRLQDAFLPWPINYLHIIPDWLIITVLGIIGLFVLKLFFYPAVACCTLIRDSSLSLTQKISSAVLPATSITWMNSRRNQDMEHGGLEDFELRVTGLEDDMKIFKTLMVRDREKDVHSAKRSRKLEGTF